MCGYAKNSKLYDILPANLVKIVEIDTQQKKKRKEDKLHSFIPFTRTKISENDYSSLLCGRVAQIQTEIKNII